MQLLAGTPPPAEGSTCLIPSATAPFLNRCGPDSVGIVGQHNFGSSAFLGTFPSPSRFRYPSLGRFPATDRFIDWRLLRHWLHRLHIGWRILERLILLLRKTAKIERPLSAQDVFYLALSNCCLTWVLNTFVKTSVDTPQTFLSGTSRL